MDDTDHIGFNDHARPEPFEDFPREAVEDRLDGVEQSDDNRQAVALAVRRLIIFAIGPMSEDSVRNVGARAAMLAYALDPGLFRGTNALRRISRQIAAMKRANRRKA